MVETGRRCERAVVTAYSELRRAGTDDLAAFQSCTTLYRIHHPEAGLSEARALVAEWIDHHINAQGLPGLRAGVSARKASGSFLKKRTKKLLLPVGE